MKPLGETVRVTSQNSLSLLQKNRLNPKVQAFEGKAKKPGLCSEDHEEILEKGTKWSELCFQRNSLQVEDACIYG